MDTHTQQDPNNPINWSGKNEICSECEEELTISDYSTICNECHNKEDEESIERTELDKAIVCYSKEEQKYMQSLDKMAKVDLILYLNNLNNIRNIKKTKKIKK